MLKIYNCKSGRVIPICKGVLNKFENALKSKEMKARHVESKRHLFTQWRLKLHSSHTRGLLTESLKDSCAHNEDWGDIATLEDFSSLLPWRKNWNVLWWTLKILQKLSANQKFNELKKSEPTLWEVFSMLTEYKKRVDQGRPEQFLFGGGGRGL